MRRKGLLCASVRLEAAAEIAHTGCSTTSITSRIARCGRLGAFCLATCQAAVLDATMCWTGCCNMSFGGLNSDDGGCLQQIKRTAMKQPQLLNREVTDASATDVAVNARLHADASSAQQVVGPQTAELNFT